MSNSAPTSLRRRIRTCARLIAPLAAALIAATCTSGDAPMSPHESMRANHLAIRPQFVMLGGEFDSEPINRIHLVARAQPSLLVLADTTLDVHPEDASWNLGIDLRLPDNQPDATVVVTIELVNHSPSGDAVQWSGTTAPITVTVGAIAPPPPPVLVFPGPPANLTISAVSITTDALTLIEGDSALMNATVTGANGTPLVIWSTLDPSVATVSASGHVRGLRNGSARVVGQAGPKADTATVLFTQRAASVNIVQDSAQLGSIGEEVTLTARVLDPRGDSIVGGALSYIIRDASIIGQTGAAKFRALANGRTVVVATSTVQPSLRDSVVIAVAQRIASASVTPTLSTISSVGGTAQLSATARDGLGNAMSLVPAWSTDNAAVATVDANGLARAVSNGTAHISATFPGAAPAAATITVAQVAANITVTPSTGTLAFAGDTVRARATVLDASSAAIAGAAVTWSTSDAAVATVDLNGLVRAVSSGVATITARSGAATGTSRITVTQRATRVTVAPRTASMTSFGETLTLTLSATDAGNAVLVNPAATWRSTNTAVASVNAAGVATAASNGVAFVVAEVDGVRDSAQVTVRQTATRITLASAPDSVAIGDTLRVRATAFDARNNTMLTPAFAWTSSANGIATVNGTGLVSGLASGRADITAAVDGQNAVAHITVFQAGPASVEITPQIFLMDAINQTTPLSVLVRDGRNNILTAPVTWLSRAPAIATVDAAGVVTARGNGTTRIVATAGGVTDSMTVTVAQVATSVVVTPDSAVITSINATAPLTATVRDRLNNVVTGARPVWFSLNPGIAVVDSTGLVRAIANGQTKVVAAFQGRADTSGIRVAAGTPNLTALPFLVQPNDTLREGQLTNIAVKVRNTGTAASTPTTVHLRLRLGAAGAVIATDSTGIPGIPAGDSISINRAIVLDTVTQYPDSVFAVIQVDANNNVAESNEADNSYGRTLRIVLNVARVQVLDASGVTPVDSLVFDALNDTIQLTAKAFDRFNRPLLGRRIQWGQLGAGPGPFPAVVDTLGRVRSFNAGTMLFAAGVSTRLDTFLVRVAPVPVSMSLFPDSLNMLVGDSARIDPQVRDRKNSIINGVLPVFVNSNPAVASFDSTRFARGLSAGVTIVHGTLGAFHDSVIVRVHTPVVSNTLTWTGAVSNTWTFAGNWSPARIPTPTDSVFIPVTARQPQFNGAAGVAGYFHMDPSTTLILNGFNFGVYGNVDVDGTITDGTVILGSGATQTIHAPTLPNLLFNAIAVLDGPMEVAGNVDVTGQFVINANTLVIHGNLSVTNGTLVMGNAISTVSVDGNAFFNGGNSNGQMTDGTLYVKGTFTVGTLSLGAYSPSGNHVTVLGGSTAQTVTFGQPGTANTYQHFNNLYLNNPAGVVFNGDAAIIGVATIDASSGLITSAPAATVTLTRSLLDNSATGVWHVSNTAMNGSSPFMPAQMTTNLLLNGNGSLQNDVHVTGNVGITDNNPIVDMAGHNLLVAGDVSITLGELSVGSGTLGVTGTLTTGPQGFFRMPDPAGKVNVAGNVTLNSGNSGGKLIAGELRVAGDFYVTAANTRAFNPAGTHTTVLNGTAPQMVSFAIPGSVGNSHHFNNLRIENPAGVQFTTDAFAIGNVDVGPGAGPVTSPSHLFTIGGNLADPSATGWRAETTVLTSRRPAVPAIMTTNLYIKSDSTAALQNDLTLNGPLTVDGSSGKGLSLNTHNLNVTGTISLFSQSLLIVGGTSLTGASDLQATGGVLDMHDGDGIVTIAGNANFIGGATTGHLTAGTLAVGGNFTVGGNADDYAPSGSHLTQLQGSTPSFVSFVTPGSGQHFNNLLITNTAGITFNTHAVINGSVTVDPGAGDVTGGLGIVPTIGGALSDPGHHWMFSSNIVNGLHVTKTWVGSTTSWENPANWSPAGVPAATDTVLITVAAGAQPAISTNTVIAALVAELNSHIDLPGNTLTITGEVGDYIDIRGAGTVELNGAGSSRGKFPNVTINGTRNVVAATQVRGNLDLESGAIFNVNTAVFVTGLFVKNGSSQLVMQQPTSLLSVAGNVAIEEGNEVGLLTNGSIHVGGDFSVDGIIWEAFPPSGSHSVVFDGTARQNVTFGFPGSEANRQHFQNLAIDNPAGVYFGTGAVVRGDVSLFNGDVTSGVERIYIGGSMNDGSGNWKASNTTFYGTAPFFAPAVMQTNLIVDAGVTIRPANEFILNGNLVVSGGELSMNGHRIIVNGNFERIDNGNLLMSSASDVLDVRGNVHFSKGNEVGKLTAGTLRTTGSLTVDGDIWESFAPSGTHSVVMNGTAEQAVSFAFPGAEANRQHFQDLVVENPAGIRFMNDAWVTGETYLNAGGATGAAGAHIHLGASLHDAPGDRWIVPVTTFYGASPTLPSSLETELRVDAGNTMVLPSGFTLFGNMIISNGIFDPNGNTVTINGAFDRIGGGRLVMQHESDHVQVSGNVHFSGGDEIGYLTAGELLTTGSFTVDGGIWEAFAPSGSHKVVLNGTNIQNISFSAPGADNNRQHFQNLQVTNMTGAAFSNFAFINGNVTIDEIAGDVTGSSEPVYIGGDLIDTSVGGKWRVPNTTLFGATPHAPTLMHTALSFDSGVNAALQNALTVDGSISIPNTTVDLNGQAVTVSGDFSRTGSGKIIMTTPGAILTVGGNATFSDSDSRGLLTEGLLKVAGNFAVTGGIWETFAASGNFTVDLNGSAAQSVSFSFPGNDANHQHFQNLTISNTSGVNIAKDTYINGALLVDGLLNVPADTTAILETYGTVTLTSNAVVNNLGIFRAEMLSSLTSNLGSIVNFNPIIFRFPGPQ